MMENIRYSNKSNKRSLTFLLLQGIGYTVIMILGFIATFGSYAMYMILFGFLLELLLVFIILRSEKDIIEINQDFIKIRRKTYMVKDFRFIATKYKGKFIYLIGVNLNLKKREILLNFKRLDLDSEKVIRELGNFFPIEVQKID